MIVTEYLIKGNVYVRYISTHTNRDLGLEECKYLPLPQSVRKQIQQQFATGISMEQIIDSKIFNAIEDKHFHYLLDIRGTLGARDKRDQFQQLATRKHFITRQDCR